MFSTVEDFERYPTEKLLKLAQALPDGSPVKPRVLTALNRKQGRPPVELRVDFALEG